MDKSGVNQEVSSMFFDSVPEMCIVIGDASNFTYQRLSLDTVIEYLSESEWIEGVVNGRDTVTVGEESVTLPANTTIRVKDTPDIVGSLSLAKEYSSLEYEAKDLQVLNDLVYKSGVFKSRFFGEIQTTGGMQITLTSSLAVVDGIVVWFETPQNVVLKAGYSTVRKDLIVIRKDQANNVSYLAVLEGIPNVNPQVPELTQIPFGVYEIPIAIVTVQPNAVSISSGDIEDVRQLSLNLPELDEKIDDLKAEDIAYDGIGITGSAQNVKEALYAVSETQLIIADGKEHFSGKYYQNADGGKKPIYYRYLDLRSYSAYTQDFNTSSNEWNIDLICNDNMGYDIRGNGAYFYQFNSRGDFVNNVIRDAHIYFDSKTKRFGLYIEQYSGTTHRAGLFKIKYTKITDSYEY